MPASPPLAALGAISDSWAVNGATYGDLLETVVDLQWPQSVATYGRMRHDPQLAATLSAYSLPLRGPGWRVDNAGCRDEVAQLVADDLGLPILGADEEPGPARRRGIRWEDHVRLALLMLVFGHYPFAQRFEIIAGRARLAALSERLPSTIAEIQTTGDGDLKGIVQHDSRTLIPARVLTWYAHEREGAAWQGRSMLRPAFGAWLLKHETWRVHATSIRRFGMGVPGFEPQPGANPTPAQILEAQRLASAARVGDQSGYAAPAGYQFVLKGMTGSVPDALAFIRYLDQQMAQSVLASVLNLDASPNGSRALGETLVGLLRLSWSAVASEIANTATGLSVQMVDYNWGEDEPAPRIVFQGVSDEATADALAALITAGAITPDPALEAWTRERYGLPERDPSEPTPPAVPPTPAAPGQDSLPPPPGSPQPGGQGGAGAAGAAGS